jgi:hypothetical protein|tara:strand:- start:481 stop:690 length:210 start_codon:yes stop_codon:yes gene_type:complete
MEMLTGLLNDNTAVTCVAFMVALANVVTAIMPSVKGNEVYDTVMRVLNWASLNVGKNRNSDDPEQKEKR